MPYQFERLHKKLPENLDRRRKLLEVDRTQIKELYEKKTAIRQIARLFPQISRRTIQFVLFPERLVTLHKHYLARGGSKIYYKGGSEWAKTISEHRRYKQGLYLAGKLT